MSTEAIVAIITAVSALLIAVGTYLRGQSETDTNTRAAKAAVDVASKEAKTAVDRAASEVMAAALRAKELSDKAQMDVVSAATGLLIPYKAMVEDMKARVAAQEAELIRMEMELEILRKRVYILRDGIRTLSKQLDDRGVPPAWVETNGTSTLSAG